MYLSLAVVPETWYNRYMKKKKLTFLAFVIIAIALLLEVGILKSVNDNNTYQMSKVLLDRVVTVLNKNNENENGLIESLKDDYIIRAKAASYIIDAKPTAEHDVEELQKIANLISVDEIHLIDKNGYIYSGSMPKYYATTSTQENRCPILSQCLLTRRLPCVRMSRLIPLKRKR